MRPGKQSWHGPCPSSPLPNVNSYLTQGAVDKEQLSTGAMFRPTKNPSIYQDGVLACLCERELESRCGLAFKVTNIKRIHFHRVLTQAWLGSGWRKCSAPRAQDVSYAENIAEEAAPSMWTLTGDFKRYKLICAIAFIYNCVKKPMPLSAQNCSYFLLWSFRQWRKQCE